MARNTRNIITDYNAFLLRQDRLAEKKQAEAEKKQKKELAKLEKKIEGIVGFEIVRTKGPKLNPEEIKTLLDYVELKGGSREYVEPIISGAIGRPFDLGDYTFKAKCTLCGSLRNYCCC